MIDEAITDRFRSRLFQAVLGDGSLLPAFQPIVDLRSGRISSFEVLARWIDAEFGTVSPARFVPLIEQSGFLDQMTDYLIRKACMDAMAWEGRFRLTFNISPSQFSNPHLPDRIAKAAESAGFPTDRLQIEITESAIFDDSAQTAANVAALKRMGLRILLDDFGTGFSSLSRLQAIPFDKLKIDASFVSTMEQTRGSRKIASAVIGLGHSLGMPVVAEGVETERQLQILLQLGCDYGQGYYFSKPVFAPDVPELIVTKGQAAHEPRPVEMSCNRRLAELDALYESHDVAVCFVDPDGSVVSISKAFCELTGLSAEAVTGKPVADWLPQGREAISAVIGALSASPGMRTSVDMSAGDGRRRLTVCAVRDEGGEPMGVLLTLSVPRRPSASLTAPVNAARPEEPMRPSPTPRRPCPEKTSPVVAG